MNINNTIYGVISPQQNYGLCNQLYVFVSLIVHAISNNKRFVIVSGFRVQIHSSLMTPLSNIIQYDVLNNMLRPYNVKVVDENNADIPMISFHTIKPPTNFDISTKLTNSNLGKHIITHLQFSPKITSHVMRHMNQSIPNHDRCVNVIHLRVEDDAILHWSAMNKLSHEEFKKRLVDTYIRVIKEHIPLHETTFLLSGTTNNDVVKFMRNAGYNIRMCPKVSKYREVNAAMDMVVGQMCTHMLISAGGSTFSHVIRTFHEKENRIKNVSIDLNHIDST